MNRDALIYYSFKYKGKWDRIYQAIKNKENYEIISCKDCIVMGDKNYPDSLLDLSCPPFVLYTKGNIDLLQKSAISIVGSRKVCEYGVRATENVCAILKQNYVLVSGLAKGVDSLVALSCMNNGHTIGVLGCGINRIYPLCNKELFHFMESKQLIISEYPDDVAPLAVNFPQRNRLIAALGQSLVVTQAAYHSGTMITVNEALALDRSIYAFPYPFDDPNGYGCNYLIQQGANCIYSLNIFK